MPVHILDCVRRPAGGAVAVRIVLEVGLEDRLQHELGGGLNRTITDGWNAERTLASSILRYHHPPHRIGPIRLRDWSSICSKVTPSTPGTPALARTSL